MAYVHNSIQFPVRISTVRFLHYELVMSKVEKTMNIHFWVIILKTRPLYGSGALFIGAEPKFDTDKIVL